MIREIFKNLQATNRLLAAGLLLSLLSTPAFAAISKPEASSAQEPPLSKAAAAETSAILNQASFIAFEGAKALEALQKTIGGNSQASSVLQQSELAQNFVKSIQYSPSKVALPNDMDALDEPWEISVHNSELFSEDGLVIPQLGPDKDGRGAAASIKGLNISPSTATVQKFMRLLQPVQNALITSPFGFRWGRPHQGIDMAAPVGTPIAAAETGKIVYSGWKQGYGNFIAVDHGHGLETHYAHCSKILVNVGKTVSKGELIGKVGNTGNSTGPHLHFEVVANGVHRNPAKYINHTLNLVQASR